MSKQALTYGDLPDQVRQEGPVSIHAVFLFCPKCGSQYSANRGDYWYCHDDQRVLCSNGHRSRLMLLAKEQRRIVAIEPSDLPTRMYSHPRSK